MATENLSALFSTTASFGFERIEFAITYILPQIH